jgi:polyhydroxyalkanoate synthesis repressor PhaR
MTEKNTVLFKKYSNRRLYNTEKSAYVTLNDVAALIREGKWVEVKDADSGEDVTAFTLTQIVMEEAKKRNALLPVPLLHLLIRYGETLLADFFDKYLEKMIQSYVSYKKAADEQFNKWLEIGVGFAGITAKPSNGANSFQSFMKQFFPSSAPESDEKKPDEK